MLKHLILKEIRDIITNSRSLFVLVICFVLIPLGLYVSTKEYEQNKTAYNDAKQMYEKQSEGKLGMGFIAEGYIPPSPLSIFSYGLSDYLPDKITTNSKGTWHYENDYGINNPIALLFGKIDFYFIVTIILSLLAFMFTFNSITGEKENGTLRLIAANAVPRYKIILAKIIGSYSVFLISFIVGIISGLVVITLANSMPVLSGDYLIPILLIILISFLFLFILFNIGILLSIKTKNSGASITASLLIWVLIAVIIPKISPMIAQVVYPIETEEVVNKQKAMKREEVMKEFDHARGELMKNIMRDHGLNAETLNFFMMGDDPDVKASLAEYDSKIGEVKKKYDDMEDVAIDVIEKNYHNQQLVQQGVSKTISRLSPVSCYTYLISDITHTGLNEISNIEQNARQFSDNTESEFYSNFRKYYKEYRVGYNFSSGMYNANINWQSIKVPTIDSYRYQKLMTIVGSNWIDLLLICFYSVLFFALSVFQFIKYDVR